MNIASFCFWTTLFLCLHLSVEQSTVCPYLKEKLSATTSSSLKAAAFIADYEAAVNRAEHFIEELSIEIKGISDMKDYMHHSQLLELQEKASGALSEVNSKRRIIERLHTFITHSKSQMDAWKRECGTEATLFDASSVGTVPLYYDEYRVRMKPTNADDFEAEMGGVVGQIVGEDIGTAFRSFFKVPVGDDVIVKPITYFEEDLDVTDYRIRILTEDTEDFDEFDELDDVSEDEESTYIEDEEDDYLEDVEDEDLEEEADIEEDFDEEDEGLEDELDEESYIVGDIESIIQETDDEMEAEWEFEHSFDLDVPDDEFEEEEVDEEVELEEEAARIVDDGGENRRRLLNEEDGIEQWVEDLIREADQVESDLNTRLLGVDIDSGEITEADYAADEPTDADIAAAEAELEAEGLTADIPEPEETDEPTDAEAQEEADELLDLLDGMAGEDDSENDEIDDEAVIAGGDDPITHDDEIDDINIYVELVAGDESFDEEDEEEDVEDVSPQGPLRLLKESAESSMSEDFWEFQIYRVKLGSSAPSSVDGMRDSWNLELSNFLKADVELSTYIDASRLEGLIEYVGANQVIEGSKVGELFG